MSLSIVLTRAALGVEAPLVSIEVHLSNGLPALTLVGLPETAVREARERVRSAIINSGYHFPAKRMTVNLAPADLPKEGGRYDLPMAIAILVASQQLPADKLACYEFLGELALNGTLRGVPGVIPAALAARQAGRQLVLSTDNQAEVGLLQHEASLTGSTLQEICAFLRSQHDLPTATPLPEPARSESLAGDLGDIIGQEQGKRALEITAAGGHNLLLIGPPGTGKTMLATRLPGLMPPLTRQEAIECAAIASLISDGMPVRTWQQRPFRAPHHSASLYALTGGGQIPRPGEVSLAHNGVLFLDELPEFQRPVLDALREPIESGEITIARARASVTFPARFQLVAAMNPSPSGGYQGTLHGTPQQALRYLNRLSGPFLDRFDLSLEIPLPPRGLLSQHQPSSSLSAVVRGRVAAARERQYQRAGNINARLSSPEIRQSCQLEKNDAQWLEDALTTLGLSVRAWQRILKVARTIADLDHQPTIQRPHLQEALSYRAIDRLLTRLHQSLQ